MTPSVRAREYDLIIYNHHHHEVMMTARVYQGLYILNKPSCIVVVVYIISINLLVSLLSFSQLTDAQTVIGFLKTYNLDKDFKVCVRDVHSGCDSSSSHPLTHTHTHTHTHSSISNQTILLLLVMATNMMLYLRPNMECWVLSMPTLVHLTWGGTQINSLWMLRTPLLSQR